MKKNIIIAGLTALVLLSVSCRENEFGTVDLTMPETPADPDVTTTYTFNHPCAMYTAEDFARVKAELDANTIPEVTQAFTELKNSPYSSLTRQPEPQELIVRGDPTGTGLDKENYAYAMRDAAAAYQTALIWKLSGDEAYANKSVEILNAWALKCKKIDSNDANQVLAAGAQGYTFACAAEMMLAYSGWAKADQDVFKQWMIDVFASKNKSFLEHKDANTCAKHCWSNWDLVNMCSYMAIGILTENSDMVNYVVNYFYKGEGNGCIKYLINGDLLNDPLGSGEMLAQDQESGRDQGHAQMSAMVTANLAQMAYSLYEQNKLNADAAKLDFFAANDNALLKLGEYVALTNLRNGTDNANAEGQWLVTASNMPFNKLEYCVDCSCRDKSHSATHTQLADDSGRGSVRPGWEIYYNHYAKVKGLSSGFIYVKQMADKMRPECGVGDSRYGSNSGAFDQLGWGTLMMYR
jgi:hypothetical protein